MGRILKRYKSFKEAQLYLSEALQMSIKGECDRYWLESCIEYFEIAKSRIRRGWD